MLKRNFSEPHCDGEPPTKRPFSSQYENSVSYGAPQSANIVEVPPDVQNPTKFNRLIGLSKKSIDESHFFDDVPDCFDKKPGATQPVISDAEYSLSSQAISDEPELPQMLLNPKTRSNKPGALETPILQQELRCYSAPMMNQSVESLTSNSPRDKFKPQTERLPNEVYSLTVPQMEQPECCIIDKLVKRFHPRIVKPLPDDELRSFTRIGRPTPLIPGMGLSVNLYKHHLWVTGCPTLKGLYCWVCLLFSRDSMRPRNSTWVREGFRNISTLGTAMGKHQQSTTHKGAVSVEWQMIENCGIPNIMTEANLGQGNDEQTRNSSPTAKMESQSTDGQNKASNTLPDTKSCTESNQPRDIPKNVASLQTKNIFPTIPSTNGLTNDQCMISQPLGNQSNPQITPALDAEKPATSESQIKSNPLEKQAQTPLTESSNGLYFTNTKLAGNSVVPTASNSPGNIEETQPHIPRLDISSNIVSSGLNDSFKENIAKDVDVSETQYLKLMEELELKERAPQPLTNIQPAQKRSTAPRVLTRRSHKIDLATLQSKYFPNGTFKGSEKLREFIVITGRLTPEMPGLEQEVNGEKRNFNMSYYDQFPWMCGSAEMNRLFCWPCFLFSDHTYDSSWSKVGYNNMDNLATAAQDHSINQAHLTCSVRLKTVESSTNNQYQKTRTNPIKHNAAVRQKRSLMKYLTGAVFVKKQLVHNTEISHDDLNNFLKIQSHYDMKLKALLDPESDQYIADFTPDFINTYSHDITKALTLIVQQKIAREVEYSAYVSFILKAEKSRCVALILRYTKSTGEVYERFYKFSKIRFGLQQDLLEEIIEVVDELKCGGKFVGISYDGGVLRPDQMDSFNSKLRSKLAAAHFFHRRGVSFLALLQQSLSYSHFGRSFFQLMTEFGQFLQDNPQAESTIESLAHETSNVEAKCWDSKTGILIKIRHHYMAIVKFLDQVANRSAFPHTWTNRAVEQSSKFSMFFGLVETRLLLVLFSKMFATLHPVSEAFSGEFDSKYWKSATAKAYEAIMDIKANSFLGMCYEAKEMAGGGAEGSNSFKKLILSPMFNDAIDWVLAFIKYHRKYIDIWSYFDFSTDKIDNPVAKTHENPQFQNGLKDCFPFFNPQKLAAALTLAQNDERFRNKSASEIIRAMDDFDFKSVPPELRSFLLLIQAVPQSSAHVSTSSLGKISAYVEGKTRLKSADALLHLEKDLLSSAQNEETVYNDVLKIISDLKPTSEFAEMDPSGKLVKQQF